MASGLSGLLDAGGIGQPMPVAPAPSQNPGPVPAQNQDGRLRQAIMTAFQRAQQAGNQPLVQQLSHIMQMIGQMDATTGTPVPDQAIMTLLQRLQGGAQPGM